MLKKRILGVVVGLALLVATTGVAGVVADGFGFSVTSQAHACQSGSSTGGGC